LNPELQEQLARAFGLEGEADANALIAALRSGSPVDPAVLRAAGIALLEHLRDSQAAQSRADQRLQIALEASELGLWDWDVPAGKVSVDRAYCRFLGLAEHDDVHTADELARITHPDDLPEFQERARRALRGDDERFHVTRRARHADGRWVWIETYGTVTHRDADGRATRMTGTHANVTERKQLERALSNTLRVMHALLETMPLPVVIRDSDRRVTLVNEAWEKMIGMSRTQIIGRKLDEATNLVRASNHHATDDQLFAQKRPLRYEAIVESVNGEAFNVLIAKTPLLAEDGAVTGIASVLIDISEKNRTAEALERARQSAEAAMHAKSRFLANMSHELRTPLNGVVGMASLLENTALDQKQRRFVRTLKSSAEALVTLINDVLDLSKAEAGKLELAHGPFELRRELEQVVGLFTARSHDKGIEIAAHIARDVPSVIHGDPIRLRQVLGNLVNNAVKFTETGAVLLSVAAVEAEGPACVLEFSVTDTGIGIAPAEQARIFEAFEQADGSVTRKFGGTGLGLTISRQLVELMHGTMHLESEADRGSRFSFRIPVAVPPVALPPAKPADDVGVIVIGLPPLLNDAVCTRLSEESAHVIGVDSPMSAIDALATLGPAVSSIRVILDSSAAPKLEQAVSGLRTAAAPRAIEVLALMPPDADATPPAGVARCLVKPLCTPDVLAQAAADTAQSMRVRVITPPRGRGRALVVEDNAVNQEMARAMLDMLGFTVQTASNGREGVAAAQADPELDLIFMDCQMPVMDGLAAARAIRASEPLGIRVPIVALTGNAMHGDREACLSAGMDDYLAKPFSLSALKAMIDKWTGGSTLPGASPASRNG
jgi:PAS domain S-box-containing protein